MDVLWGEVGVADILTADVTDEESELRLCAILLFTVAAKVFIYISWDQLLGFTLSTLNWSSYMWPYTGGKLGWLDCTCMPCGPIRMTEFWPPTLVYEINCTYCKR